MRPALPLTMNFPGRYVQGPGVLARLDAELARLGTHAACLLDPVVGAVLHPALDACTSVRISRREARGGCTVTNVAAAAAWIAAEGADLVVAFGGGKVVDTARAAADDLGLTFVCVPTIAASDAPCSALAVIYDDEGHVVEDRFVRRNPALVLVDTELLVRAPVRFFVSGIGDALATWFEADSCARSGAGNLCGGTGPALAMATARLCHDALLAHAVQAVQDCAQQRASADVEATVEASILLSGLGFESGGVAAAHAIHHGLAELEQTHAFLHGEKVAIGLLASLFLSARAQDERLRLFRFCRDVGLPTRLAQIGVDAADVAALERVAERACRPGEIIHNEPFAVTAPRVVGALLAMDHFAERHL